MDFLSQRQAQRQGQHQAQRQAQYRGQRQAQQQGYHNQQQRQQWKQQQQLQHYRTVQNPNLHSFSDNFVFSQNLGHNLVHDLVHNQGQNPSQNLAPNPNQNQSQNQGQNLNQNQGLNLSQKQGQNLSQSPYNFQLKSFNLQAVSTATTMNNFGNASYFSNANNVTLPLSTTVPKELTAATDDNTCNNASYFPWSDSFGSSPEGTNDALSAARRGIPFHPLLINTKNSAINDTTSDTNFSQQHHHRNYQQQQCPALNDKSYSPCQQAQPQYQQYQQQHCQQNHHCNQQQNRQHQYQYGQQHQQQQKGSQSSILLQLLQSQQHDRLAQQHSAQIRNKIGVTSDQQMTNSPILNSPLKATASDRGFGGILSVSDNSYNLKPAASNNVNVHDARNNTNDTTNDTTNDITSNAAITSNKDTTNIKSNSNKGYLISLRDWISVTASAPSNSASAAASTVTSKVTPLLTSAIAPSKFGTPCFKSNLDDNSCPDVNFNSIQDFSSDVNFSIGHNPNSHDNFTAAHYSKNGQNNLSSLPTLLYNRGIGPIGPTLGTIDNIDARAKTANAINQDFGVGATKDIADDIIKGSAINVGPDGGRNVENDVNNVRSDVYLENAVRLSLLLTRRLAALSSQTATPQPTLTTHQQHQDQQKYQNQHHNQHHQQGQQIECIDLVDPSSRSYSSGSVICAQDVVADNIVVHISPNNLVEGVDFVTTSGNLKDAQRSPSGNTPNSTSDVATMNSSEAIRSLLHALGIVLFEIFSKGHTVDIFNQSIAIDMTTKGKQNKSDEIRSDIKVDENNKEDDLTSFDLSLALSLVDGTWDMQNDQKDKNSKDDGKDNAAMLSLNQNNSHVKKRKGRRVNQNNACKKEAHDNHDGNSLRSSARKSFSLIGSTSSSLVPIQQPASSSFSSRASSYLTDLGIPLSIRRLVCDLIDANTNKETNTNNNSTALNNNANSTFASFDEIVSDLTQMQDLPGFLYDNTSVQRALERLVPLLTLSNQGSHHNHRNYDHNSNATGNYGATSKKLEPTDIYGRENEMEKLLQSAHSVLHHTRRYFGSGGGTGAASMNVITTSLPLGDHSRLIGNNDGTHDHSDRSTLHSKMQSKMHCEVVFLSGHAGCGKSRLTHWLMDSSPLNAEEWFVISCKFDRQVSSLMTMAKAFDSFFQEFVTEEGNNSAIKSSRMESFRRILQSIVTSMDEEGFCRLGELIPNLYRVLPRGTIKLPTSNRIISPLAVDTSPDHSDHVEGSETPSLASSADGKNINDAFATSMYNTGAGKNRLNYLFQLLVRALRCGNIPLVILLDDLHWADPSSLEVIATLVISTGDESIVTSLDSSNCGGLLLLSNYRDNEAGDELTRLIQHIEDNEDNVNVTKLAIGGLPKEAVNQMLSINLCLPTRITRSLAHVVYQKTMGNPLFVTEFMKSIVRDKMLTFSVKARRWIWDEDSIEIKVISKNVAELLTRKLRLLPEHVLHCLELAACFGSQVDQSVMLLLNGGNIEHVMISALDRAVEEGLMEKAGSIYAFSHDMVQQAAYELIPEDQRMIFHQGIGMLLALQLKVGNPSTDVLFLAVEQISACKGSEILSQDERTLFAQLNLAAAKRSIAMSSFERANRYLETGISFLEEDHWHSQYSLSLKLYELSASACLMNGIVESVSPRLDEILRNSRSFEDSLNANALLVKLLGSSGRYAEAVHNCLRILSSIGEGLPEAFDMDYLKNEVAATKSLLKNFTRERVLQSPKMTDLSKINAMKFMSMLSTYSFVHKPMLMPILACRMIRLSLQYGFCEESITGLTMFGHILVSITDDNDMGNKIGRVAESLIADKHNQNALRARLYIFLYGYARNLVEPFQSFRNHFLNAYNAGMLAGDLESAAMNANIYCLIVFYNGMELKNLEKDFTIFSQQMAKHRQYNALYNITSSFHACTSLSGSTIPDNVSRRIGMKTDDEIIAIGKANNNELLLQQIYFNQMYIKFWFRDFTQVSRLAEKYQIGKSKRTLDYHFSFYYGLAALNLARATKDPKWKQIGVNLISQMEEWTNHSKWNFENKLFLMKAEVYFLEGDRERAELAYEASIMSSNEHRFVHEEGLACELYGLFLMEISRLDKSLEQFQNAFKKYILWGAYKKAESVKFFIDYANSNNWRNAQTD